MRKLIALSLAASALACAQQAGTPMPQPQHMTKRATWRRSRAIAHKPLHAVLHGLEVTGECVGAGAIMFLLLLSNSNHPDHHEPCDDF